jgi:hypothetical protein
VQQCVSVSTFRGLVVERRQPLGRGNISCHCSMACRLCLHSSISPPKAIRRHHHLAHQAVLDTKLGIYLYRRPLACGCTAGCWAAPFDASHVDLRTQRCGYHWRWRERRVCYSRHGLFVAVLAPPAVAALAPSAADTVFAPSEEGWERAVSGLGSLGCADRG